MADIDGEDHPESGPSASSPFEATLVRWPGPGGWVFASVPPQHAPDTAGPFGRVPVTAMVDGHTWSTSVWRDKKAGWLLPISAKIRRGLDHGDEVSVVIDIDDDRL